jgi:glycosyltransferase involved in cell wall biosynthesis
MADNSLTEKSSELRRLKAEMLLRLYHKQISEMAIISTEPLIFFIPLALGLASFRDSYKFLFDSLRDRKVYIICPTYWYFERQKHIEKLNQLVEEYKTLYPRFDFTFLSNTLSQHHLFVEKELNSIFCSSNCFVDENIFYPIPGAEKIHDAVYDARFEDWKRHFLAININSLGLIYHKAPFLEDTSYVEKIKRDFSFAKFFNLDAAGQYKTLSAAEVNEALNRSRIGLCLSAEEGAMFASIQYLLAGLPVVTTRNIGGRDEFFDRENSLTVEETPAAVARGVKEMIDRNLSAESIRARAIDEIMKHRKEFIKLGQKIYEQENCDRKFKEDYEKRFTNKLVKRVNHHSIIQLLTSPEK